MKIIKKCTVLVLTLAILIGLAPSNVAHAATKKLKVTKSQVVIYTGGSATLKTSGFTKNLKWTSSDKNVATVSSKGVVKAKAAGKATITVTYKKQSAKCKVTVKKATLKMKKTQTALTAGGSTTLKTSGITKDLTWSSNNKKVATVSNKGVVKAKAAGKATITVKYGTQKATCTVAVSDTKSKNAISKLSKLSLKSFDNITEYIYSEKIDDEHLFMFAGYNKTTNITSVGGEFMKAIAGMDIMYKNSNDGNIYYKSDNTWYYYTDTSTATEDDESDTIDSIFKDVQYSKYLGKKQFNGKLYNLIQLYKTNGNVEKIYYDDAYRLIGQIEDKMIVIIDYDTPVEIPQEAIETATYKQPSVSN